MYNILVYIQKTTQKYASTKRRLDGCNVKHYQSRNPKEVSVSIFSRSIKFQLTETIMVYYKKERTILQKDCRQIYLQ